MEGLFDNLECRSISLNFETLTSTLRFLRVATVFWNPYGVVFVDYLEKLKLSKEIIILSYYNVWARIQCSQIVDPSGPHHWPVWILTQANTSYRCVSTFSLRFHDPRCRAKIESYVSLDFVWKWRGADEKFKMTEYII